MANILLTQKCVRKCAYCFAGKHMKNNSAEEFLSWENLIYIADFLQTSGENHISLLGGEPTLHPEFTDFLLYLTERNFHINVFTSGIMNDKKMHDLRENITKNMPEKISFVCNLNEPRFSVPAETARVKEFLELFSEMITPGFNIYRKDFNMDFLIRDINEFGLKRHIRIGLAHPIPGAFNISILPQDMDAALKRLAGYFPAFERLKMKPGLDCGFPLCKFTDSQIGWIVKNCGMNVRFGCGPAIDIGTDMSVWSCFPLSNFHKKSLFEFNTMRDVVSYYEELHGKVREESGGIYDECDSCVYREQGICFGGCIAGLIDKFGKEAPVRMPEVYL